MPESTLATILLIEDDPADVELLCRGFQKATVLNPILHLKTGDDALAYFAGLGKYGDRLQFPLPALVLLDLKLPGMSGLDLLQWRRAHAEIRRIPFVVLTGNEDALIVTAAYDLGANSYLVKPGERSKITEMVRSIQQYWIKLNHAPQLVMRAEV